MYRENFTILAQEKCVGAIDIYGFGLAVNKGCEDGV